MSQSLRKCVRASVPASKTTYRSLQTSQSSTPKSRWGFQEPKKPWELLPTTLDSLSDINAYLSKPSWSVTSLLNPSPSSLKELPEITPKTLSHLLNLSALPQPETREQEEAMLETLRSQLHFVREIQSVDTTNVQPLSAIREETEEAKAELTIGLDSLSDAFRNEETTGRMGRPRRRPSKMRAEGVDERQETDKRDLENRIVSDGGIEWSPLRLAPRVQGHYIVVETEGKVEPGS